MEKFLGLGKDFVERYHARTGNAIFLRIKRQKVPKEVPQESTDKSGEEGVPEKVSRLAIGLPGGFNVDEKRFDTIEHLSIVVLPGFKEVTLGN
jgi:ubiquitin carboxyl-terminal hydrolase 5/13